MERLQRLEVRRRRKIQGREARGNQRVSGQSNVHQVLQGRWGAVYEFILPSTISIDGRSHGCCSIPGLGSACHMISICLFISVIKCGILIHPVGVLWLNYRVETYFNWLTRFRNWETSHQNFYLQFFYMRIIREAPGFSQSRPRLFMADGQLPSLRGPRARPLIFCSLQRSLVLPSSECWVPHSYYLLGPPDFKFVPLV